MDLGLSGRRALVTGAATDVGFGCARALAAEGCDVALAGADVHALKTAVKAIRADYRVGVTSHATDLTQPDRQEAMIDVVGDVDVFVNDIGPITPPGDLASTSDLAWRTAWDEGVFGAINLTRLVLPRMEERGRGAIVLVVHAPPLLPVSSHLGARTGNETLLAFARTLGSTSLARGVRVVAVETGLILTAELEAMLRRQAELRLDSEERWEELLPRGVRPGPVDAVADAVAFAVSARASYLSGTVITVDGGVSAR